jgi:hypothetical protein
MRSREERCRWLTEIAHHVISDFGTIASAASLKVAAAEEATYRAHLAPGRELRTLIEAGVLKGDVGNFARVLALQNVVSAEKVLSSGSIVLAHLVADDVFSECCDLAIDCDPAGWVAEIEKKVTVRELREKGADAFEQKLKKLARQLRGKSLPRRADILFRHAPIVQNKKIAKSESDYFCLSTLKELDELRHHIVHHGGMSNLDVALTNDRVGFLREAASTAIRSVAFAYNIVVDNKYLDKLFRGTVT